MDIFENSVNEMKEINQNSMKKIIEILEYKKSYENILNEKYINEMKKNEILLNQNENLQRKLSKQDSFIISLNNKTDQLKKVNQSRTSTVLTHKNNVLPHKKCQKH
jgi:hypothetical protein